jgi:hypothetical protein
MDSEVVVVGMVLVCGFVVFRHGLVLPGLVIAGCVVVVSSSRVVVVVRLFVVVRRVVVVGSVVVVVRRVVVVVGIVVVVVGKVVVVVVDGVVVGVVIAGFLVDDVVITARNIFKFFGYYFIGWQDSFVENPRQFQKCF